MVLLSQLFQFQHIQMQLVETIVVMLDQLLQFPGCKLAISCEDHLSHCEILIVFTVLISAELVCFEEVNTQVPQYLCFMLSILYGWH